jgi:hypothetical protein
LHRQSDQGVYQPKLADPLPERQGEVAGRLQSALSIWADPGGLFLQGPSFFAGIYRLGVELGPGTASLYSGPAIILPARVPGWRIAHARR